MNSATELLRTSFIKGIAKTTASVTVLGVVTFFYYLYNNTKDVKQDISEKTKLDIKKLYSIDFTKVFNNKRDNKRDNKKDNKKDKVEMIEIDTIETCDAADVDNTVDVDNMEVNYIHDLDVFEKNVYEDKNFKKLFDKL